MKPISLVHKYDHDDKPCCPSGPYEDIPRVYLSGPKSLAEVPEEGTITFKFKRKEASIRDGDRPVSLTLELLSVENTSASEVEKKEPTSGEAIDKLFKELDEEED